MRWRITNAHYIEWGRLSPREHGDSAFSEPHLILLTPSVVHYYPAAPAVVARLLPNSVDGPIFQSRTDREQHFIR